MPEVLLSRTILQYMGFNIDAHLKRMREEINGVDLSNVWFEPSTNIIDKETIIGGRLARLIERQSRTPQTETYGKQRTESTEKKHCYIKTSVKSHLEVGLPVTIHLKPYMSDILEKYKQDGSTETTS